MKKLELKPGVKYRGYFFVNEFGEVQVVPEDTGSRAGQKKLLSQGDGFTVSYTKRSVIVHLNIKRRGRYQIISDLSRMFNSIFQIIKNHEL